MGWRPKNWQNPFLPSDGSPPHPMWRYEANAFEEGADAMLKALQQRGLQITEQGMLTLLPPDVPLCPICNEPHLGRCPNPPRIH